MDERGRTTPHLVRPPHWCSADGRGSWTFLGAEVSAPSLWSTDLDERRQVRSVPSLVRTCAAVIATVLNLTPPLQRARANATEAGAIGHGLGDMMGDLQSLATWLTELDSEEAMVLGREFDRMALATRDNTEASWALTDAIYDAQHNLPPGWNVNYERYLSRGGGAPTSVDSWAWDSSPSSMVKGQMNQARRGSAYPPARAYFANSING